MRKLKDDERPAEREGGYKEEIKPRRKGAPHLLGRSNRTCGVTGLIQKSQVGVQEHFLALLKEELTKQNNHELVWALVHSDKKKNRLNSPLQRENEVMFAWKLKTFDTVDEVSGKNPLEPKSLSNKYGK